MEERRSLPQLVPLTDEVEPTIKPPSLMRQCMNCFGSAHNTAAISEPPELSVLRICVRNDSAKAGGFVPVMYIAPWQEPRNKKVRTETGGVIGRYEDDFDEGVATIWRGETRVTFAARYSAQFAKDELQRYVALEFDAPGTYCITLEGHWQRVVVAAVVPPTVRIRTFATWPAFARYMARE